MMSAVARVKFIKTKVIFRHHTKGVSNQVSSNSNHEIKSYSYLNSGTKMGKNEKNGKMLLGYKKMGNKGVTNRGSFKDFKSGQRFHVGEKRFQIRAEITNRGKRDF